MTTSFSRTTSRILAAIFLSAVVTNAVAEDSPHQNDPLAKAFADYVGQEVRKLSGVDLSAEQKSHAVKSLVKAFGRKLENNTCRTASTTVGVPVQNEKNPEQPPKQYDVGVAIDVCKKNEILIVGPKGIKPLEP